MSIQQVLVCVILIAVQGGRRLYECMVFAKLSSSQMWVASLQNPHARRCPDHNGPVPENAGRPASVSNGVGSPARLPPLSGIAEEIRRSIASAFPPGVMSSLHG
ncbi:hypothetical protein T310_9746 [Rasamsonia emersonii CBS 393.64]|uniref:Secreted protein n=1 Tax=Rasamsonia emersonii (strain ATCC 16479 / CBS 393.64 / IMI 116815) TaxID=1408163 RepID=A0A0F4YG96_RASE3|nr:hypothetical protein T310_9746 [Rasamsonia emersonii CBS 393.64]KKA16628.1 hypothetical protein T310_9746 [Rasamsonia emersonii CBS 393.64]